MKLNKIPKSELELLSYIEIAKMYLKENKTTKNTAELFREVCSLLELSENEYNVISSGIQQISLIQILLDKYKLQPGSFLIIDEPEVNLHPEWQFKFAEILVLLAKELDINIYLNSHSPMFIEAMEVLTQYYDLEEDTNFYLTEKHDKDTYNFVKIEYDNLYELYDNLAKPFDAIEVYRLKNEYKNGNY